MIGEQIRRLREAQGIELQDLAERAGISTGHLCRIERGERSLGDELEAKLVTGILEMVEERERRVAAVAGEVKLQEWLRERLVSVN